MQDETYQEWIYWSLKDQRSKLVCHTNEQVVTSLSQWTKRQLDNIIVSENGRALKINYQ